MATFSENSNWIDVTKPFNTDYHIAEKTNILFSSDHPFFVGDYLTETSSGATGILYELVSLTEINVARDSSTLFPATGELSNGTETFSYNSSSVTHGIDNDVSQRLVDRTKWLYDNKTAKTILLTAGAGLTGGGDLSTNRTISLGTPSTCNVDTTNIVSGATHTHYLERATEFRHGIARFATATEYLAGNYGVALDPHNFLQHSSRNGNGYQRLPGGLIIQWGKTASAVFGSHTLNFPITFTNTCLFAIACKNVTVDNYAGHVSTFTSTQLTLYVAVNAAYMFWLAIGY